MPNSDLDFVARVRLGRRDDVEAFVGRARVIPGILISINARLGWPLRDHELEDVCQDTVARLWRKLSSFDGSSKLETWFYGVARFELLNAVRRKQRRRSDVSDAGDRVDESVTDLPSDSAERVHEALERLEPELARLVVLHHFEFCTLEQAAARVGVPVSTAKSRYYRAMERLGSLLRERRPAGERA